MFNSQSIIRNFGLKWFIRRAILELKFKSGWYAVRFPKRKWRENEIAKWIHSGIPKEAQSYYDFWKSKKAHHFVDSKNISDYRNSIKALLDEREIANLIALAEELKKGSFTYFSVTKGNIGFPPNWHINPFTQQKSSSTDHWSRIPVYSQETGDIKYIWEPGRFGTAYLLSRVYWLTGDESYAETFWQLIESWYRSNPPNTGAHWRCGQEISIRIMAWCFALYAFADSPTTTPFRVHLLVGMIAAQAHRVSGLTEYAYLQQNNHSISEGVGLWTVGILFPELKYSKRWRAQGKKILEIDAERLIDKDGSFSQKSNNYHRLMLQDYLYAIRIGEVNGYTFSDFLLSRVRKAGEFLIQMLDRYSGHVPNLGGNDGALIIPLNNCDYQDYRPVCGSINYLFNKTILFNSGPWNEDLFWFFGPEALNSPIYSPDQSSMNADSGGYYTLVGSESWAMVRCDSSDTRPTHADMLHADIWFKGINLTMDAGSYRYYDNPPWNDGLKGTDVHNTIMIDNTHQMDRGSRFIWTNWVKARTRYRLSDNQGLLDYFEGEHFGYKRLANPVTHRRAIARIKDLYWIIVDDILGVGIHQIKLHWLLPDYPFEKRKDPPGICLTTPEGRVDLKFYTIGRQIEQLTYSIDRGSLESAPLGWVSHYYGVKEPAISNVIDVYAEIPLRILTIISINSEGQEVQYSDLSVNLDNVVQIDLNIVGSESIVRKIQYSDEKGKSILKLK